MGSIKCPCCCSQLLKDKSALVEHLLNIEPTLKCPICNKSIPNLSTLINHLQNECNEPLISVEPVKVLLQLNDNKEVTLVNQHENTAINSNENFESAVEMVIEGNLALDMQNISDIENNISCRKSIAERDTNKKQFVLSVSGCSHNPNSITSSIVALENNVIQQNVSSNSEPSLEKNTSLLKENEYLLSSTTNCKRNSIDIATNSIPHINSFIGAEDNISEQTESEIDYDNFSMLSDESSFTNECSSSQNDILSDEDSDSPRIFTRRLPYRNNARRQYNNSNSPNSNVSNNNLLVINNNLQSNEHKNLHSNLIHRPVSILGRNSNETHLNNSSSPLIHNNIALKNSKVQMSQSGVQNNFVLKNQLIPSSSFNPRTNSNNSTSTFDTRKNTNVLKNTSNSNESSCTELLLRRSPSDTVECPAGPSDSRSETYLYENLVLDRLTPVGQPASIDLNLSAVSDSAPSSSNSSNENSSDRLNVSSNVNKKIQNVDCVQNLLNDSAGSSVNALGKTSYFPLNNYIHTNQLKSKLIKGNQSDRSVKLKTNSENNVEPLDESNVITKKFVRLRDHYRRNVKMVNNNFAAQTQDSAAADTFDTRELTHALLESANNRECDSTVECTSNSFVGARPLSDTSLNTVNSTSSQVNADGSILNSQLAQESTTRNDVCMSVTEPNTEFSTNDLTTQNLSLSSATNLLFSSQYDVCDIHGTTNIMTSDPTDDLNVVSNARDDTSSAAANNAIVSSCSLNNLNNVTCSTMTTAANICSFNNNLHKNKKSNLNQFRLNTKEEDKFTNELKTEEELYSRGNHCQIIKNSIKRNFNKLNTCSQEINQNKNLKQSSKRSKKASLNSVGIRNASNVQDPININCRAGPSTEQFETVLPSGTNVIVESTPCKDNTRNNQKSNTDPQSSLPEHYLRQVYEKNSRRDNTESNRSNQLCAVPSSSETSIITARTSLQHENLMCASKHVIEKKNSFSKNDDSNNVSEKNGTFNKKDLLKIKQRLHQERSVIKRSSSLNVKINDLDSVSSEHSNSNKKNVGKSNSFSSKNNSGQDLNNLESRERHYGNDRARSSVPLSINQCVTPKNVKNLRTSDELSPSDTQLENNIHNEDEISSEERRKENSSAHSRDALEGYRLDEASNDVFFVTNQVFPVRPENQNLESCSEIDSTFIAPSSNPLIGSTVSYSSSPLNNSLDNIENHDVDASNENKRGIKKLTGGSCVQTCEGNMNTQMIHNNIEQKKKGKKEKNCNEDRIPFKSINRENSEEK